MDLRALEEQLEELAGLCERLAMVLKLEREAMTAWKLEPLQQLAEEKGALVDVVVSTDRAFKAELDALCRQSGQTVAELLALPASSRVRTLWSRVEGAREAVKREGELNRRAAEHGVRFLRKLQGDPLETPGYSRAGRELPFSPVHHVV